jgi:serine protease inhibitor
LAHNLGCARILTLVYVILLTIHTPNISRAQKIIVVNSTADSGPGTLREALEDAESYDTITFDPTIFPPDAPATIAVMTQLPHIHESNLTLDASQAGVILDGSHAPGGWEAGLQIVSSEGNKIWGLQISHFSGPGIAISGGAKHNVIGGDRSLGAGPSGRGNMLSNNRLGIDLATFGTSFNTITGNLIGTDAEGTDSMGNSLDGVVLWEGAQNNTIGPDNIIANNGRFGVYYDWDSLQNTIIQNIFYDNGGGALAPNLTSSIDLAPWLDSTEFRTDFREDFVYTLIDDWMGPIMVAESNGTLLYEMSEGTVYSPTQARIRMFFDLPTNSTLDFKLIQIDPIQKVISEKTITATEIIHWRTADRFNPGDGIILEDEVSWTIFLPKDYPAVYRFGFIMYTDEGPPLRLISTIRVPVHTLNASLELDSNWYFAGVNPVMTIVNHGPTKISFGGGIYGYPYWYERLDEDEWVRVDVSRFWRWVSGDLDDWFFGGIYLNPEYEWTGSLTVPSFFRPGVYRLCKEFGVAGTDVTRILYADFKLYPSCGIVGLGIAIFVTIWIKRDWLSERISRARAEYNTLKKRVFARKREISIVMVLTLIGVSSFIYIPGIIQGLAYAKLDEKASSVDGRLVDANTEFAFKIFKELMVEDEGKNIFISPLSISTALLMAYNGADGSTMADMAGTLELGYGDLGDVNEGYLDLLKSLKGADRQVSLSICNSIWIEKGFEPRVYPAFIERLATYYDGEMFARNFGAPGTIDEINGWISEKTNEKIDEMISEIDPEMVMFLINAIYFKGDWVNEFDESKTRAGDFFLPDGEIVRLEMMSTKDKFSYYAEDWGGEGLQIARLPYGRDKIAMYIFLPGRDGSLESLLEGLNQTMFDDYLGRLSQVDKLNVKLPKFKLEYGTKRLNDALTNLGMGVAFDMVAANFSGIAPIDPWNLYIDFVDHKAFIEVNEKGTEAAATTVVGIALTSASPMFYVDRPFFFAIRDDRSGSILFMGKIVNPLKTKSP